MRRSNVLSLPLQYEFPGLGVKFLFSYYSGQFGRSGNLGRWGRNGTWAVVHDELLRPKHAGLLHPPQFSRHNSLKYLPLFMWNSFQQKGGKWKAEMLKTGLFVSQRSWVRVPVGELFFWKLCFRLFSTLSKFATKKASAYPAINYCLQALAESQSCKTFFGLIYALE